MKRVLLVCVCAFLTTGQSGQPSAAPLLKQVFGASATTGFRFRATLTRTNMQSKGRQVHQLIISGRRTAARSSLMFRVAWPPEASGEVLVIDDRGDHQLGGFRYQAGRFTPLTSSMRSERLLGSDLTLEDLEFAFWFWPAQTIVGGEAVGEHDCTIIESRPPAGWPTNYSRVKSWISPALSVPLRIEAFGANGSLAKRLGMYRILKLGNRWLPAILTVEPADGRTRTVIEGVKYESGLKLSDIDFSRQAAQRPLNISERRQDLGR